LAVFYPYRSELMLWQVLGAAILLLAITLAAAATARRSPWLTVGWLWYLGTLVPVIGLVQAGDQAMADRYTYLPLIGVFILVAWGIPEVLQNWRGGRLITTSTGVTMVVACFILTTKQLT